MSFTPSARPYPTSTSSLAANCAGDTFKTEIYYELESDIVDQCDELINDIERDTLQRPSSRLGFNSSPLNAYNAEMDDLHEATVPGGMDATTSSALAFDVGEDITTLASTNILEDDIPVPLSTPSAGLQINTTPPFNNTDPFLTSDDEPDCSDSDTESDCSSCDDSDDDLEISLNYITLPPSRSRLSVPALVAPVARPAALPPPTSKSLTMDTEPPSMPPLHLPTFRLDHNNHGYSRHALLHLKWFWTLREGKWADYDSWVDDSKAYGGMADLGQPSHSDSYGPLRSPAQRNLVQHFKNKNLSLHRPALPPMSVHPRRGDIASLRDPYCTHIDRCFVHLPSWTLAKTLYMFDMHVGCEWRVHVAAMNKQKHPVGSRNASHCFDSYTNNSTNVKEQSDELFEDVDLDSENESLGTSGSVVSSDDSDATLVESENEDDPEQDNYSAFEAFISGTASSPTTSSEDSNTTPRLKYSPPSHSPTSEKRPGIFSLSPTLYSQQHSPRAELLSAIGGEVDSMKPWATNWYRRWEILMELVRLNWGQDQLFSPPVGLNKQHFGSQPYSSAEGDPSGKGKRRLKRQPHFYVATENSEENESEWDSEWGMPFELETRGKISYVLIAIVSLLLLQQLAQFFFSQKEFSRLEGAYFVDYFSLRRFAFGAVICCSRSWSDVSISSAQSLTYPVHINYCLFKLWQCQFLFLVNVEQHANHDVSMSKLKKKSRTLAYAESNGPLCSGPKETAVAVTTSRGQVSIQGEQTSLKILKLSSTVRSNPRNGYFTEYEDEAEVVYDYDEGEDEGKYRYWAARALQVEKMLTIQEERRTRELAVLAQQHQKRHASLERLVYVLLMVIVALILVVIYQTSMYAHRYDKRQSKPLHFTIPILSPFTSVVSLHLPIDTGVLRKTLVVYLSVTGRT
ncbi:hypothetical protein AX17_002592 [Amanita inopinata Kibby_2008]|nr:hypothetical protein AX17_002592 [Amanita inopinata Kibby_2008]